MKHRLPLLSLAAGLAILLVGCGFGAIQGSGALIIDPNSAWPDGLVSVQAEVTGGGLTEPIVRSYTSDTSTWEPLTIAEGDGYSATVVVSVDNASPVTEWTATADFQITGGEQTTITIAAAQLAVTATRLVIPDSGNQRIVQIDAVDGSGWSEQPTTAAIPDLEIGPDGRIYYVQPYISQAQTNTALIEVRDSISDATPETAFADESLRPDHLGIDHANGHIYFVELGTGPSASPRQLYRVDLNGTNLEDYTAAVTPTIDGQTQGFNSGLLALTVDDNGTVFALYSDDSDGVSLSILELDPDANNGNGLVVGSAQIYSNGEISASFEESDIVAKHDALYVVVAAFGYGDLLMRVSYDGLLVTDSYGDAYDGALNQQSPEVLYGPSRFIAHQNAEIQFVDEDPSGGLADRVVQIDDITGAGRSTYGQTGSSAGQFHLYYFPQ